MRLRTSPQSNIGEREQALRFPRASMRLRTSPQSNVYVKGAKLQWYVLQ